MGIRKGSRSMLLAVLLIGFYVSSTVAQSSYWLANIAHQGLPAYGNSNSYPIFRNVKDYGAVGDGLADDTKSINNAISAGSRCGEGICDSSTTTPALIYFPPGTYRVTSAIVMYYFSELTGDPTNPPTLVADPGFDGIAVLDADVYIPGAFGAEWYGNTNNFYRKVRNFIIDLRQTPFDSKAAGIHWQVAQATSLQNIVFRMRTDGGANNKQTGIFMENGSGGFMTDLRFEGGNQGAFLGNQQFTTRNLVFVGCRTAIYLNFSWLWTFSGLSITGAIVGIDMSNSINPTAGATSTGSVLVMDSFISAGTGILTRYGDYAIDPVASNSIILDNVDFTQTGTAISDLNNKVILNGGSIIQSFGQGHTYTTVSDSTGCTVQNATVQQELTPVTRQGVLLDSSGRYFSRSKPQYENLPATSFVSAKSSGCTGNGVTDDTSCVQNFLNTAATSNRVAFFDHGAYVVSQTITVPPNIRIVGEIWPTIMATGSYFSDQNNPKPVFSVGTAGSVGAVEMSDIIFSSIGPVPGAIMVQWNLAQTSNGAAGMWDVHFRIGGAAGTKMQSNNCLKTPTVPTNPDPACEGAFLLLHITSTASLYLENVWAWVADHELDLGGQSQINIYNGRGILIESTVGPVWLWGTASEHSVLYNYQLSHASNVFLGLIQTETAYMQGNPSALTPFTPQTTFSDPTFSVCPDNNSTKTWGLRVVDSTHVYVFGAGLYSFFDNYNSNCIPDGNCQTNIVDILDSSDVYIWDLTTIATQNMITLQGHGFAYWADNEAGFAETIVVFEVPVLCALVAASSIASCAISSSTSSSSIPPSSSSQAVITVSVGGGGGGASGSGTGSGLAGGGFASGTSSAGVPVVITSGSASVPETTTAPSSAPGSSGSGSITTPVNILTTSGASSSPPSGVPPGPISSVSSSSGSATGVPPGSSSGVSSSSSGVSSSSSGVSSSSLGASSSSSTLYGLSATGTLSAFGQISAIGTLTSGGYSTGGLVDRTGAAISGSAGISGAGTATGTATATGTLAGSGYLSGSGTIDATGYISASGVLSGSGYVSSAGFERSGYISTSGTVVGSGIIRGLAMSIEGRGYVSGSGTMTGVGYLSAGGPFPSATSFGSSGGGSSSYGTTVVLTIIDCETVIAAKAPSASAVFPLPSPPSASSDSPDSPARVGSASLNDTLGTHRFEDLNSVIGGGSNNINPLCPICPGDIAFCCPTSCGGDGKCPREAVRNAGWMAPGGYEVVGGAELRAE